LVQYADNRLRQWVRASLNVGTVLGVAMIGVIWAGLGLHLNMEEKSAVKAAKQNSGNLARAFEEHVVRSIGNADKILLSLRAAYAKNPAQFDIENARVYLDSMVLQVAVIGPDGFLIAGTSAPAGTRLYLGDREHYRVHLNTDNDELFISKPVIGRTTDQWSIQLSRRIANPDGSFGGVIVASLDQSYLGRFYDSFDIGKDGSIVVTGLDKIVRVSRGFKNINPDGSFSSYSPYILFEKLSQSPTGFFETYGQVDGLGRLVSYRKIETLPLVVAVGLARREVLAHYRLDRQQYYIAAAGLTAVILIVIGLGAVRKRKFALAAASLRRSNMLLDSALQNMPHGLSMFDANQQLIVANNRYAEMYGLTPEQIKPGMRLREILDARVAVGSCPLNAEKYIVDRLGALSRLEFGSFVIELKNGRIFAVNWQPMPDGGSIAVHEDITDRRLAEDSAAAAHQELIEQQYAVDQAVTIDVADVEGRIIHTNDKFCQISGYSREELLGANHRILKSGFHPEKFYRDMYRRIVAGQVWRGELCNKAKDGSLYWVDTTIVPQLGPDGKPIAYMAIRIDITTRRRAEADRDRSQKFLDIIIEHVPAPIYVKDAKELRYILDNQAGENFLGVARGEMIGKTAQEIFPTKEADLIAALDEELLRSGRQMSDERQIITPRNGIRSTVSKRLIVDDADGKSKYLIGVIDDITERKLAEATIINMARHDALTGIANRIVLREKLEQAAAYLQSRGEGFTVLILDLDEFKYINDTLGHAAGDQLLKELALRLRSSLEESDTVARLGGDEFAIIQTGATNQREQAIALAIKVLDIVAQPFDLDGHNVTVQTSIGIALAPENGTEPGELLKKADLALYRVKAEGRNSFSFFDEEMSEDATARHRLLNDLRAALSREEFELHYQPLIDAKTTRPCGVEALVRWRHPVEGLLSPDRFIWLAEESGLMEPLGEWILERACTDAASWPANIKVAVNLSAAQFRSGKLFDVILCALVESGLSPERLELEITESVLLQNKDGYRVMIQQLKNLGISIVLDDFGTGYSSLSYLTRFPFDKIKIDKSFTQELSSRADCAAVVASVLTLARGLDIAVTAEGVETKQQFDLLCAAGVDQVQGYLFGRPVPAAELDFSALEQKGRAVEAA
jgi:diguanylate cyclase (GGDEF)-like protein/PAS domain S-box-containing protein